MTDLSISLNLSPAVSGSSQFTADWGNINGINDTAPVVFWASDSGATTADKNAKKITFSGLGKTISITLAGAGNLRYIKNGTTNVYSASFTVTDGDVLSIGMLGPVSPPLDPILGNLTVTNSTDSYVIDTIPFYIEAL